MKNTLMISNLFFFEFFSAKIGSALKCTIGFRIKALRNTKEISQEELAEVLNVSRQTISKWESDIVSPDINNIQSLSNYFNVRTDYTINGNEKEPKSFPVFYIIFIVVAFLLILLAINLLIINKGASNVLSTINISLEVVLIIIGVSIIASILLIYKHKK